MFKYKIINYLNFEIYNYIITLINIYHTYYNNVICSHGSRYSSLCVLLQINRLYNLRLRENLRKNEYNMTLYCYYYFFYITHLYINFTINFTVRRLMQP